MQDGPTRRQKVHAGAGLVWPLMILGNLVLLGRAAYGGRETFLPHAEARLGWAPLWLGLFGLALTVWAGTAVALRFELGLDASMRRLRRFTALPAALFALVHAWLVWGRVTFGGADARFLYASLLDTLGHAAVAWVYAIGCALTALQLEQAARVVGETFGFPRGERERRWYGAFAIVVSVTLLFFAYDGLGVFVAGQPLFGVGR